MNQTELTPLRLELPSVTAEPRRQWLDMVRNASYPEVQGNHLAVRVLRAAWQGDRKPHVCDFAGGHVRVIHALPEVSPR